MAGAYDVVIAAGVENMTRVPMGASFIARQPCRSARRCSQRYPNLVPQGISAELIAEKWNISREDNDRFSVESHKRAAPATATRAASTARSSRSRSPTEDGAETDRAPTRASGPTRRWRRSPS